MPDYFPVADRIREDSKFFDVSLPQIDRDMDSEGGEVEYETEHYLDDIDGTEATIPLRLNLSCKSANVVGWTASLKLHGKRIDGIDWHARYRDKEGNWQSGWHRHDFDIGTRDDKFRIPVDGFDGIDRRVQFIGHALRVMGILLNEADHGSGELQFG
jgi:hypothetical protein